MSDLYTPKGEERRTHILQAVISLIAHGEVTDLSFERIARVCNIRRSLVVYYFKTPADLLRNTIEYAMSFGQTYAVDRILLASTAKDRLDAFVEANFAWFQEYPEHAAVFGFLNYLASSSEGYRELHSKLADMAEKRLEAILLGGPLKPRAKVIVPKVAVALRAHLVGAIARCFTSEKRLSWQQERENVLLCFHKLSELVWEG